MSAHAGYAPAPVGRRLTHGLTRAPVTRCSAFVLAALVSGCAGAPPAPVTGAHPADPQAQVRPAAYQPVIGASTRQRPRDPVPWREKDPVPWREKNERVTPQEKP
jgi:hypothetical protein